MMQTTHTMREEIKFPSFPAYPMNGGKLDAHTPAKVGQWVTQPKIDDWRAILHVPTKTLWNRHGKLLSITHEFAVALGALALTPFEFLDCGAMERRHDMMRGSLIVFDIIPHDGNLAHSARRVMLEKYFQPLPMASKFLMLGTVHGAVFLINQFNPATPPLDIYNALQCENQVIGRKFYEGIVQKNDGALYPIQLRSSNEKTCDMIKHRFDQP